MLAWSAAVREGRDALAELQGASLPFDLRDARFEPTPPPKEHEGHHGKGGGGD